jgi:acyl-coenzyme A synthetase/AMP-(fatty) acid ligase
MACVVTSATPDEALARHIADHCRENLAYFKAPGYVAFVDKLPLTATQKLQRGGLRTLSETCAGQGVNDGTCFDLREFKKRG